MIEKVKEQVSVLLGKDNSGHGMEHINRVLSLSLKFAEAENANIEVVSLIALLHDVDDYKLFGVENAKNLTNARKIMDDCSIADDIKKQVLSTIETIGFGKRLKGIKPVTIEGMVVSDADMCDGIGVSGFLRTYAYHLKHNSPFFDKNIFPIQINGDNYTACARTGICHVFEKQLRLKDFMLTASGREEAIERHNVMVKLLYQFFKEENVLEWTEYLDNFLSKSNSK